MTKSNIIMGVAFLAAPVLAHAQVDNQTDNHTVEITIPEVAILDIEPAANKNIAMAFTHSGEAGDPLLAPAANNSLWLNYSSIKSAADPTRTISVKLTALVPGVDIKVTAAAPSADGDGTKGTPSGQLTLTATDQTIISAIGSAYTGNGTKGHNLTYELDFGNSGGTASYADLTAATVSATVTYTISDN